MTVYCQSCGKALGPEPSDDRPMGWIRMLCEDCFFDMDLLTTQDSGYAFEDEDEDDEQ